MPSPLDSQFWEAEAAALYEELLPLFLAAFAAGLDGGTDTLPPNLQPLVNPNVFNQAAIDFTRQYRYTYIKDITETTMKQTQDAIVGWIQGGQSLDVLEQQIAGIFGEARAARIASTETTRAFALGNQTAFESTGFVDAVEIRNSEDDRVCPICSPLGGTHVGVGDIDAMPPFHPGCRCWIIPTVNLDSVNTQLDEILGL